ncbi:MAG: CBS domain-containing protein [Candidatus Thermoplasmatota archaeon]|jgi:signal-transduction protein with cAMP-binding, CBS, and nucleotidyltransferase domain|nr:CBS domain-containing protein [Candidatus Thermoplasmatota archaeon]
MVLYARDVMKAYTRTFSEKMNALEAAKVMMRDGVGFLIIVDGSGKPSGIVTEWDYLHKVVAEQREASSLKLSDIMTAGVIGVEGKTPTDQVTEIMFKHSIRRVPVFEQGKLVGVITSRDIIRIFREYMDNLSRIISRFSSL